MRQLKIKNLGAINLVRMTILSQRQGGPAGLDKTVFIIYMGWIRQFLSYIWAG